MFAMKAVVLESYGEPEVLKVADVPEPTADRTTWWSRSWRRRSTGPISSSVRGDYPGPGSFGGPTFEVPGMELSGRVVEHSYRVGEWSPWTRPSWRS